MPSFDPLKISRDLSLLEPQFRSAVEKTLAEANALSYSLAVFEAFRTPERQESLYAQGRTSAGKIVTKARAWESFHQYGLAVDTAFFVDGKWTWDGPWDAVTALFKANGVTSLAPFERPHFQMTGGLSHREASEITTRSGLQTLWQKVRKESQSASSQTSQK